MMKNEISKQEIVKDILKTRNKILKLQKTIFLKESKDFYNYKKLISLSREELNGVWDDINIELFGFEQDIKSMGKGWG